MFVMEVMLKRKPKKPEGCWCKGKLENTYHYIVLHKPNMCLFVCLGRYSPP